MRRHQLVILSERPRVPAAAQMSALHHSARSRCRRGAPTPKMRSPPSHPETAPSPEPQQPAVLSAQAACQLLAGSWARR